MNYVVRARAALARKIDVEDDLLDLYTLLVLVSGTRTKLSDVHDAWATWRTKTKPDHDSLVPFSDLSADVQERDRKYVDAIRQTAEEIS
jgi:hypothetical protein